MSQPFHPQNLSYHLPPYTSSSSSTTTTPSSSTSEVMIKHPLPNLENYIKSLDQKLPQTNINCQLTSLDWDPKQFILSLHHKTLKNWSDSKNHHQSSQIKQLLEHQVKEHDLAITDWQIQKRLERENQQKVKITWISYSRVTLCTNHNPLLIKTDNLSRIREKLVILLQRQDIIFERQQQSKQPVSGKLSKGTKPLGIRPIDQAPRINPKQLKTIKLCSKHCKVYLL
ncbi:hypothetical protein BY996DRAFT_6547873 [Phakopsora pachyrhizi]|nr:hypothetical protein BY996DRAFT_6547873 [Phakopsora pachyrhizi]